MAPTESLSSGKCSSGSFSPDNRTEMIYQENDKKLDMEKQSIIKPTIKRYIVLFLYCLSSGNKAFQWIQIPAGTKKISYFYDVDTYVINGTSVVFLLACVVLSLPACFLIERIGIRKAVLMASFGAAVGSIIKCFSCHQEGIVLLYISQILVSAGEQLIFSVPSRLASVWFPDHQVSTAVGTCILGNQVGVAVGFIITQVLLNGAETREEIGQSLIMMYYGTAALSIFAFVANIFLFDEAPEHAPGVARLKQIKEEESAKLSSQSIWTEVCKLCQRLGRLMCQKDIMLLNLSFSISYGVKETCATIMNQVLGPHWPGNDLIIGNAGFCLIIFGALFSVFWGRILDMTRRYLLTNILLTIAHIIVLASFGYAVSFMHSEWTIYLLTTLTGIAQVGLIVSAMELAIELSYPAPELVTASLMNIPPQIFGIVFIFVSSYIVENHGNAATIIFLLGCLTVALVLLFCVDENLRRQKAVTERRESNIGNPRSAAVLEIPNIATTKT